MFSSMSLRSLRTVSALEVVQPIWSVYVSTSSDSLLALRPSLIFILRLRFFFPPMGGCPGFPFFGVGGRFVGLVLGGVGLLFGGGLACGFGVGGVRPGILTSAGCLQAVGNAGRRGARRMVERAPGGMDLEGPRGGGA